MDAQFDGCGVVGQYGDAYRLVHLLYSLVDRLDETLVEVVDGFQLEVDIPVVTGLVSSFYVYEDEVVSVQGVDGSLCLALVVGVGKTGGSRNFDDAQSGIFADALYEVDGRDDCTALDLRILLH